MRDQSLEELIEAMKIGRKQQKRGARKKLEIMETGENDSITLSRRLEGISQQSNAQENAAENTLANTPDQSGVAILRSSSRRPFRSTPPARSPVMPLWGSANMRADESGATNHVVRRQAAEGKEYALTPPCNSIDAATKKEINRLNRGDGERFPLRFQQAGVDIARTEVETGPAVQAVVEGKRLKREDLGYKQPSSVFQERRLGQINAVTKGRTQRPTRQQLDARKPPAEPVSTRDR